MFTQNVGNFLIFGEQKAFALTTPKRCLQFGVIVIKVPLLGYDSAYVLKTQK